MGDGYALLLRGGADLLVKFIAYSDSDLVDIPKKPYPHEYIPSVSRPRKSSSQSDIERLLDVLAASSELLNLPEDNPSWWEIQRRRLDMFRDESTRETFNEWRKRVGKDPVSFD